MKFPTTESAFEELDLSTAEWKLRFVLSSMLSLVDRD
jgi:hypothetical protein